MGEGLAEQTLEIRTCGLSRSSETVSNSVDKPTIAILTAVQLESRAVASALQMKCPGPQRPTSKHISDIGICLHLVGIGASKIGLIRWDEVPRCVVMAGVAGALDPALKVGDVVSHGASAPLVEALGALSGRIHTSTEIVCTPNQKAELFRATGALAVDMETALVERWARDQDIRFIAVRAISDSADDELDPRLLSLVDSGGRPKAARLAAYLIANPLRARKLAKLGADSKQAAKKLGSAVRDLVHFMAVTPDNLGLSR